MPFLRTLKLYPIVFLFTHGFYTTNHISSDPSCDWYSLGLSYYMSSECSSISACVCSFNLGEPLYFPSCLWSFISATSAAFTFPFSMIVLSAYQNHHSAACHFISKLIRAGYKLFLVVQVTFLLCPCLSYCEHSSASLPLDVYETELRKESDLRWTGR